MKVHETETILASPLLRIPFFKDLLFAAIFIFALWLSHGLGANLFRVTRSLWKPVLESFRGEVSWLDRPLLLPGYLLLVIFPNDKLDVDQFVGINMHDVCLFVASLWGYLLMWKLLSVLSNFSDCSCRPVHLNRRRTVYVLVQSQWSTWLWPCHLLKKRHEWHSTHKKNCEQMFSKMEVKLWKDDEGCLLGQLLFFS